MIQIKLPAVGRSFVMNRYVVLLAACFVIVAQNVRAEQFVVQGSTTFYDRIMTSHLPEIERVSKQTLVVIPTKTSLGLLALFEMQADFAMISTELKNEVADLKGTNPDLTFDNLQTFKITNTRMAFAVHPSNPVRSVSASVMRRILVGEITNWREIGGEDKPIRLVFVRDGGGVQTSVQGQLLEGAAIRAPDEIRVQVGTQVLKVVEQEPGALGISQLGLVRRSSAAELLTDVAVDQTLSLVTLGPPTAAMRSVIGAAQHIMNADTAQNGLPVR
jgi:phosphate transport system substrate-binding protein